MIKRINQINSRLHASLDDILNYATECKDKLSLLKPDAEDADSFYSSYKNKVLTNIITMADRSIKLYDNQQTIKGILFYKLFASQFNDILRVSLEEIKDNALSYRNETYSLYDETQSDECELVTILDSVIKTADNALSLYTSDLIRNSTSDETS